MNQELKIIKKKYGEQMAHLCRSLFPTILETEGLLLKILTSKFNEDRLLYSTIIENNKEEDFKDYIYSFIEVKVDKRIVENKTPKKLLDEAGYILYECRTIDQLQSFKKYYTEDEELCSFKGNRLKSCYVFFAVKKNVDEIRREDFTNPSRQDEYGTSVISIQFTKGEKNTLSIKNRYNSIVNNPDATFSNNLDNIIPGLNNSFQQEYNLNIIQSDVNFKLPNYVLGNDGKLYKYNHRINNIYYCPNNIIIDNGEIKKLDKSKYVIIDYFIIDLKEKTVTLYDKSIDDSFIDGFKNINKIEIKNNKSVKEIYFLSKDEKITIKLNKTNEILSLDNPNLIDSGEGFLQYNIALEEIELCNLTKARNYFLYNNNNIKRLNFPRLKSIENFVMSNNNTLQELIAPELISIGNSCLEYNRNLHNLYIPNITSIGTSFLYYNNTLREWITPNLTSIGPYSLYSNRMLEMIYAPQLFTIGSECLHDNKNKHKVLKYHSSYS